MVKYMAIARDKDGNKVCGLYEYPETLKQVTKFWRRFCKDNSLTFVSLEIAQA